MHQAACYCTTATRAAHASARRHCMPHALCSLPPWLHSSQGDHACSELLADHCQCIRACLTIEPRFEPRSESFFCRSLAAFTVGFGDDRADLDDERRVRLFDDNEPPNASSSWHGMARHGTAEQVWNRYYTKRRRKTAFVRTHCCARTGFGTTARVGGRMHAIHTGYAC